MKLSEKNKGIVALITLAACYAFVGVFTRYLALSFTLFQQIYFRLLTALVIGLVVFYRHININKLKKVKFNEWLLLLFRSFSYYLLGVVLFNKAILLTKISTVSFISSIPMVAILSFIILKEKITLQKIFLITMSFIGVIIISVKDLSLIFMWGNGEIIAFLSVIATSLSIVFRRFHSKTLNNREITLIIFFMSLMMIFAGSLIFGENTPSITSFTINTMIALFLGGFLNVAIIFLTNYGFEKIQHSIASNILTLEMFFGVLFGLVFFREIPNFKELIGGIIILFSVIKMNQLE